MLGLQEIELIRLLGFRAPNPKPLAGFGSLFEAWAPQRC